MRIALPQHYMFGAMNVVRQELDRAHRRATSPSDPGRRARTRVALGKILDLELAIMLHTYREDLLAQQARSERLATFGQLVGSIGHELRNPLGVIETLALHPARAHRGGRARDEAPRSHRRAGRRRQPDHLRPARHDPRPAARRASASRWRRCVGARPRAFTPPPGCRSPSTRRRGSTVRGDPVQLRQVFVNLLENAVQAPSREASSGSRPGPTDGRVALDVEDDGPGRSPSRSGERLFEPLITTKAHGIGLGLALVKRIVERHGGSIAYEPGPGGGARFIVRTPGRREAMRRYLLRRRQPGLRGEPRRDPARPGRDCDIGESGAEALGAGADARASTRSSPTCACPAWAARSWSTPSADPIPALPP